MSELKPLTITALTKYIKRKFDVDPHLQDVWLKGEISNFKQHSRGHMYFTLKDEHARMSAVMFSSQNKNLPFIPENGMKVLARGEVSVYEGSGNYQLYIRDMQPDGVGSLHLAYEQLKNKLEGEGLFDPRIKKPLPLYPNLVGVVTSPTGAAVRDIMTTIKRRYPVAQIILIPALVQGDRAPASIVSGIKKAKDINADVLIIGRGGGSIEELWGFNDEKVARAIYESKLPIISAVGHETDFTIADFVADMRAPTPTAAAELAVPNLTEVLERISQRKIRLTRAISSHITAKKTRLERTEKSYAFRYPTKLLEQKEQQLDLLLDRLHKESKRIAMRKEEKFSYIKRRLLTHHPYARLKEADRERERLTRLLQKDITTVLNAKKMLLSSHMAKLNALSPLKIMERGYSLVYNEEEKLVKSTKGVAKGETVTLRLKDGSIDCLVEDIRSGENE
ncbi:exodeoxyribonuclease VII large subunit [Priestia endophytica]|uniref:Exodeoxyribonuclease 7 large subunit n=1 Tax=Priestia endophytica DSM 13796 TaxID=1121089 RepID=A0A1I5W7U4_9BACI|nr:exodeoxyribonuclease VII large subunit [Priestia endophytica]KYG36021.1 exodeoxyribonuclease VII large subunit [Priestia endophytica]SFQ15819.1 Exodeoxyribonuclease VII large subunit [Priestia endophytica DSM 13796]